MRKLIQCGGPINDVCLPRHASLNLVRSERDNARAASLSGDGTEGNAKTRADFERFQVQPSNASIRKEKRCLKHSFEERGAFVLYPSVQHFTNVMYRPL